MTDTQIKALAAQKLAKHGIQAKSNENFITLAFMIEQATGLRKHFNVPLKDFVRAFACPPKSTRHTFPFRPLRTKRPHLRQDEIDALPRPISTGGIGIGVEGRHGFGKGR